MGASFSYMYVVSLHVHVQACMHVCERVCVCRSQKSTLGVFLDLSPS